MKRHIALLGWNPFLLGLALLTAASCAVEGGGPGSQGVPPPPPMDAARMGLEPALRPFYDELQEYGDWMLVEPQGWVFRPNVNTVAWRPYQDGHWEPSYSFGWVWQSNEPFGWITDHYGFWFHDDFQGWLWKPYGAWAPSWVAWVQVGNYVGWAPLAPDGTTSIDNVPGGAFTYVPASTLGLHAVAPTASYVNSVPDDGSEVLPIDRVASYRGVSWNAGPDPAEVLGRINADRLRLDERESAPKMPAPPKGLSSETKAFELPALENRTKRAWNEARREFTVARAARAGAAPSGDAPAPGAAPSPKPRVKPQPGAEPDSLRSAPVDSLRTPRGDGLNGLDLRPVPGPGNG
jgi:hypothetical protein